MQLDCFPRGQRARQGDARSALALYERILAHDLDFPRARVRAERLRFCSAVLGAGLGCARS